MAKRQTRGQNEKTEEKSREMRGKQSEGGERGQARSRERGQERSRESGQSRSGRSRRG
jgi:hypothetical protein